MKILALEQSTPSASAALMSDQAIVAEREWSETRSRNQQLFEEVPCLLEDAGCRLEDIDVFAGGLGPGSFTSLRIAVAALRAYALPRQTPVVGVPSDAALSARVHEESGNPRVTIIGDARRERFWVARYAIRDGRPELLEPRRLIPYAEFDPNPEHDGVIATPDWERLRSRLEALAGDSTFLCEARIPRARDVARLATDQPVAAESKDPLTPIYLHPPVFVEPRFPEASSPLL
jgi:tRNA threonylcarbamoyladenosine biosynthesis protein TsaB